MVHAMALTIAAAAFFALPVKSDLYPKSSAVLTIDSKNYKNLIAQSNYTSIVEFYAPWCGHCKNLQPIYENAAKRLHGLAIVAALNCDRESNKAFCGRFGVEGYPTIKIFKPGNKSGKPIIEEYKGPRTVTGIYEAVVEKIPDFVAMLKEENIEEWIGHSDEIPKAVLFSVKPNPSPHYKALAIEFKGSIQFAQLTTTDDGKGINKVYNIKKLPTLFLIKNGETIRHDGGMKKQNLVEFLSRAAAPNPDPAPVNVKSPQPNDRKKTSNTKINAKKSTSTKYEDSSHVSPSVLATPIPILSEEVGSESQCLSPKTSTCVLVLVPESEAKATESILKSLSVLIQKHKQQKRTIFPFYVLPESNPKFGVIRKTLSLTGEADVVAVNGKRKWWRKLPKLDLSSTTAIEGNLEIWISEIQLGEGEKMRLPDGLLTEESEEPSGVKVEDISMEELLSEEAENPVDIKLENKSTEKVVMEETVNSEEKAEYSSTEEVNHEKVETIKKPHDEL